MSEKIKRVGLVTLHGYYNYGNRLQNFALQEVIRNLGFNVETIIIHSVPSDNDKRNRMLNNIKRLFKTPYKEAYKKVGLLLKKKINDYLNSELVNKRTNVFKNFSSTYILERFYNYSNDNLTRISNEYDFFVVGSDQVWKLVNKNKMPIYFLTFAQKEKRIAYAPSFGTLEIPTQYREQYKLWLLDMAHLSVREEAGAEIIKELTGLDAVVLVDPTLLISKEKWLSISREDPNKPRDDYILTYFLGGMNKETKLYVEQIAKEYDLKVINLADIKDKRTYIAGPNEFIDYINSAKVLFTDSFHGVVFSILMETPFIVYKRVSKSASMYSRIETLLDMFRFRTREAHNIRCMKDIFDIDFSHVPAVLDHERKKALDYLKNALGIKDAD